MTILPPQPQFSQSVDANRPHTLLTKNIKHSGYLIYRYDDTQELVQVPHTWYNSHYQSRAEYVRFLAKQEEERATKMERYPPFWISAANALALAQRYRARAARIRAEAEKIEAQADPAYPVQAARLELDFGDPVQ